MLRIAILNKGSLSAPTGTMLQEAGYRQRTDAKERVIVDDVNGVEFFYLRPGDIAVYVGCSQLDIGIAGHDLLLDSEAAVAHCHGVSSPVCCASSRSRSSG